MELKQELKKYFGFDSFRTGQEEVIKKVIEGNSVTAIFPTGAGKSLCYQLPSLLLPGLTVVVSPLISLMHDQLSFLKKHSVKAAVLDSTLSRDEYQNTLQMATNGELKVLMISVERFKNERFRNYLVKMNISLLVVDEAHCISEWGHNFRPEYLKLPKYITEFEIPQVLLLTATATLKVASDICKKLNVKTENCIRTGFYRDNLFLNITPVTLENKKNLLIKRLRESGDKSTIVYVTLQKTAEYVSNFLTEAGLSSKAYHAGLKSDVRADIQRNFMDGKTTCIVATIAFGMGIDKSDIRQVFHYDLPKSIENYSQEIGRAGRDGKPSFCEVFANRDGITVLENFIYGDTPDHESIILLLNELSGIGDTWEIKPLSLSNEVNIRQLPLKTLLVYLDIKGIISSMYSYFAEYQFKTNLNSGEILSRFNPQRQEFLKSLFKYTEKKRTWVTVKLDEFLENTGTDRVRAISALEYLDAEGLIELSAKQSIEVYRKNVQYFDKSELGFELCDLFKEKEDSEIKRVDNMIKFFESEKCLSTELAGYFGEDKVDYKCGHCSVCEGNAAVMEGGDSLPELTKSLVDEKSREFINKAGENIGINNIIKFLCGISMPKLTKLKARGIPGFSSLEKYPYRAVKETITKN